MQLTSESAVGDYSAFHGTSLFNALKIVETNSFVLSSVSGKEAEARFAKQPFFLSTRRNRLLMQSNHYAVTLELDSLKLNALAKREPVDYWQYTEQSLRARSNEQEDRYYFRKPKLLRVIHLIKAVHFNLALILGNKDNTRELKRLKPLLLACKKHKINVHLYKDEKAYNYLNTRKTVPLSELNLYTKAYNVFTTPEEERPYIRRSVNRYGRVDLMLDTLYGNEPKGDKKDIDYAKRYFSSEYDVLNSGVQQVNVDLHNASAAHTSPYEKRKANRLTLYMREHGLSVKETCLRVYRILNGLEAPHTSKR